MLFADIFILSQAALAVSDYNLKLYSREFQNKQSKRMFKETHKRQIVSMLSVVFCLWAANGSAQEIERQSFQVAPSSILSKATPVIDIARNVEAQDFEGNLVEEALNFNLGLKITPIAGLNLQADAWRQEIADAPAVTLNTDNAGNLPQLYIEDSAINEFNNNLRESDLSPVGNVLTGLHSP